MLAVWGGTLVLLRHSSVWDYAVPQKRPWAHPISALAVHSRKSLLSGSLGSISFSHRPPANVHWNSSMRAAVDWKGIGRRLLPAVLPPAIANCHAIEPREEGYGLPNLKEFQFSLGSNNIRSYIVAPWPSVSWALCINPNEGYLLIPILCHEQRGSLPSHVLFMSLQWWKQKHISSGAAAYLNLSQGSHVSVPSFWVWELWRLAESEGLSMSGTVRLLRLA